MALSPTEKREIVVNLIGYGYPESNLWIMGYEESKAGEFNENTKDEEFLKYKDGYTTDMSISVLKKYSYPKTYGGYYRLIENVFPEYNKEDSKFFVSNLLSFGKKDSGIKLEPNICKIFGADNPEELYNLTINERHDALIKFFERYHWRNKYIVFCIGIINSKEEELKLFLSKLYKIDKEEVLNSIFKKYNDNININESSIYLYKDKEQKKFITYQASSRIHIDRAIDIMKDIKQSQ